MKKLLLLGLLLAGCAPTYVWVRDGETVTAQTPNPPYVHVEPASRDHAECLSKFQMCNAPGLGCLSSYEYCMESKGYHRAPKRD
ncbi:MAG: hypothetical protein OER43_18075 [Gammaproteobacteria bacterium]|nr:hypothetical protein [Gammaproteobacteria bacterium]